jgi:hypothetical protein
VGEVVVVPAGVSVGEVVVVPAGVSVVDGVLVPAGVSVGEVVVSAGVFVGLSPPLWQAEIPVIKPSTSSSRTITFDFTGKTFTFLQIFGVYLPLHKRGSFYPL